MLGTGFVGPRRWTAARDCDSQSLFIWIGSNWAIFKQVLRIRLGAIGRLGAFWHSCCSDLRSSVMQDCRPIRPQARSTFERLLSCRCTPVLCPRAFWYRRRQKSIAAVIPLPNPRPISPTTACPSPFSGRAWSLPCLSGMLQPRWKAGLNHLLALHARTPPGHLLLCR